MFLELISNCGPQFLYESLVMNELNDKRGFLPQGPLPELVPISSEEKRDVSEQRRNSEIERYFYSNLVTAIDFIT